VKAIIDTPIQASSIGIPLASLGAGMSATIPKDDVVPVQLRLKPDRRQIPDRRFGACGGRRRTDEARDSPNASIEAAGHSRGRRS
jgi:hypothetical protein